MQLCARTYRPAFRGFKKMYNPLLNEILIYTWHCLQIASTKITCYQLCYLPDQTKTEKTEKNLGHEYDFHHCLQLRRGNVARHLRKIMSCIR